MRRWLERWLLLLGAAATAIAVHPTCNLLFACGCAPAWAGAEAHCNVHAPSPPHCPWCAGTVAAVAVGATLIGLQALGLVLARRLGGRRLGTSLVGVLAGYAAGALVAGWVAALVSGYPTFLGISLSSPSR